MNLNYRLLIGLLAFRCKASKLSVKNSREIAAQKSTESKPFGNRLAKVTFRAAVHRLVMVLDVTKLDKCESSGYDAFTIVLEEKVT